MHPCIKLILVSMLQQHAEPASKRRKCLYRDATLVRFIVGSKKDCYTAMSELISAHSEVCAVCLVLVYLGVTCTDLNPNRA